jgi:hypothetical protein
MGLQFTIARAVAEGVVTDHLPFVRTDKGGVRKRQRFAALFESIIAGLLISGSVLLIATNKNEVRETYIFALVLAVQSLPFLAATIIAAIERSAWNDFVLWRKLGAKFSALVTRRVPPASPPAIAE